MDQRERSESLEDVFRVAIKGALAGVWTALPGMIESFDASLQTASVQPTIQAQIRKPTGETKLTNLPLLLDCPVHFPGGGDTVFTFPVRQGDECLVVFSSRCIDSWWQSGGVQPPATLRMHNLSDGFAIVGFRSKPRKVTGFSTTAAQLRSLDGATLVEMNPTAQTLVLTAPGGATINADTTINGALHVTGAITCDDDITSSKTVTGQTDVVGGGKHLKTHTHSGVQSGGSNTGAPN